MHRSIVRRWGAALAGVTLAAAFSTSAGATTVPDGSSDTTTPATTGDTTSDTSADTTAGSTADTTAGTTGDTTAGSTGDTTAGTGAGTVEAAPSCTGKSDGVLKIGSILPETGNLAFLGPPEFAAVELAVGDINEAGGVLDADVELNQLDSGDTSTNIATQSASQLISEDTDAVIGAASSGVSFTFIDQLVENCIIHFSPANTSPDFTDYDDGGLYFRSAPSDVLQGRVLSELMIEEGVTNAVFMAIQDPYGEGLLKYSSEPFAEQGGEVLDSFTYDPQASTFDAEADRVVSADPEALVLIGFEESAKILQSLFEKGFTSDAYKIYLVDGNVGNALGEQLPAGSLVGVRGTLPGAETTQEFRDRLLEVDPNLQDYSYAGESYDAVTVTALAAVAAGSDNPAEIATHINGITRDGEKCTDFASCKELLDAGTDIDYDGISGPLEFSEAGEPTEASFGVYSYDENNRIDGDIAPEYKFAEI